MFNDPQMIQKLANNPKTRSFLADPHFMQKLQRLKNNPNDIGTEMQDPRFLQVMSVLLGIDMSFGGAGGEGGMPDLGSSKEVEENVPMPDARPSSAKPAEPTKAPEPEPDPEPEDQEAATAKKAKEQAEGEKKLGTENYKKRQFDVAIEHYDKAWSMHKDITYLTNKSAAQFEKGDYDGAIETCKIAIGEGREVLADFKTIAKYIHPSYIFRNLYSQLVGPSVVLALPTKSSATCHKPSQIIRSRLPNIALLIFSTSFVLLRRPRSNQRKRHISIPKKPRRHESLAAKNLKRQIGLELLRHIPR